MMQMTDEEISIQYRDAKNKKQQIEILSQMNLCTKEEMAEKLKELGLIKPPEKLDKLTFSEQFDALYAQGLCDAEIAAQLGAAKSRVTAWRKNKGLHANWPKKRSPELTAPEKEAPEKEAPAQEVPPAVCETITYRFKEPDVYASINLMDKTVTIDGQEVTEVTIQFETVETLAEIVKELEKQLRRAEK